MEALIYEQLIPLYYIKGLSLYCSDFQKTKWSVGAWLSSVFLIIVLTNKKNEILGQRGM